MWIRVLGSAAGGGVPQWNCHCNNCRRLRLGTLRTQRRSQAQAAVSINNQKWHLLNASPDLRLQIEATQPLWPSEGSRHSPISSVILTSAEIDAVVGLLSLREFQPFTVHATRAVSDILLEDNSMFQALHRVEEQVEWSEIAPGQTFQPEPGLCVQPISLGGGYPQFVREPRQEGEAVLGLKLESAGKRAMFLPGLASIDDSLLDAMSESDLVLLDGTFWSDDELIRIRPDARTARNMGHVPISGAGGTLERLAGLERPRKVYIHLNNTNPVLDEDSPEHQAVREAGFELAFDGMEFRL
jgi:pyrroloquinoline quinone biosynthesis protein B